jgi:uncharacterized RDD family membrane protein YckC
VKNIEITTSQKVTIQYELATLSNRFFAYFIDSIVSGGICLFLSLLLLAMFRYENEYISYIIIIPIFVLYHLISEILLNGQSVGKRSVGIKVVKLNGDTPQAYDYFMRWFFRGLDLWASLGTVGALMSSASPNGQRVGDLLAGTTVIKQSSSRVFMLQDILKIATLDSHSVTYPNVVNLSESDMLFVKLVLEREQRYSNPAHQYAARKLSDRLIELLNISTPPKDRRLFLRTLLNDYIVLTR